MNNEKDKELDDFFRRGLEDPVENTGYMDDDWDKMEQLLDKPKKRGVIVYWLPILSGVAALLLLFLGWWAFRPAISNNNQKPLQAVVKHQKLDTGMNGGLIRQQIAGRQNTQPTATIAATTKNGKSNGSNSMGKTLFTSSAYGARRDTAGAFKNSSIDTPVPNVLATVDNKVNGISPSITGIAQSFDKTNVKDSAAIPRELAVTPPVKTNKIKVKVRPAFHPQYALSVLAAPDINGVSSFQQSKVGTNLGLGFSAGISRKLTVSTGVLYSVKPYITAFANYHTGYQFQVNPVNVTADCRMLDIPLNIGYQLYNKHQNKISIGTGLSSYIMLHENYKFNYADSYATGPASYTVPRSGKYFFGVANLNATYERQLNEKMGISVQPYLKLPLTDIGYSQVRLQTTGVAVGITWNLNSLSKP